MATLQKMISWSIENNPELSCAKPCQKINFTNRCLTSRRKKLYKSISQGAKKMWYSFKRRLTQKSHMSTKILSLIIKYTIIWPFLKQINLFKSTWSKKRFSTNTEEVPLESNTILKRNRIQRKSNNLMIWSSRKRKKWWRFLIKIEMNSD